jgi:hypothetical protein
MKNTILALLLVGSFASGCASGAGLAQRGSVVVSGDSVKVLAAGPAVLHAFSMDRGGGVFIAPATTGTDADCALAGPAHRDRATPVKVDQRNVVAVGAGQVACLATNSDRRLELLWHTEAGPAASPPLLMAQAGGARAPRHDGSFLERAR